MLYYLILFINFIAFTLLKCRYRLKVKGLNKILPLMKKGGVLFLPNHPAMMDPGLLFCILYRYFKIKPIVSSGIMELPFFGFVFKKIVKAIPMMDIAESGNNFVKSQINKTIHQIYEELKKGQNILFYPAGMLKKTGLEDLRGCSGAFNILKNNDIATPVLVRFKGLWGSSFSKAQINSGVDLPKSALNAFKMIFLNLFFFVPKRDVEIEFHIPDRSLNDFDDKMQLNSYLSNWYNASFEDKIHGEPLVLVKEYFYSSKLPLLNQYEKKSFNTSCLTIAQKNLINSELARLSGKDKNNIEQEMNLGKDLELDSLNLIELIAFLDEQFNVKNILLEELHQVGDVYECVSLKKEEVFHGIQSKAWPLEKDKQIPANSEEDTLPSAFLDVCKSRSDEIAFYDERLGFVKYKKLLLITVLLSKKIRKLEGINIGILLPASAITTILIFATHLAGKKPVMLNWTLGSKNLKEVVELSSVKSIVTSMTFLRKAKSMDLENLDSLLFFIEDMIKSLSVIEKIKAFFVTLKSKSSLKKYFKLLNTLKDEVAVYLFTSGSESKPKGVPLTHGNILSNMKDFNGYFNFQKEDVMHSFLPPFHSFGFTATTIFPILYGIKVFYSSDPTDGLKLARYTQLHGATIICTAPTFLKALLNHSTKEGLCSLKWIFLGAEKASEALFDIVNQKTNAEVFEGYGITECSPIISCNRPGNVKEGVGKALKSVEIAVVDLNITKRLEVSQEGMILVRGPSIFSGYLQKDQASPFVQFENKDWYNTQDMGFLTRNENLVLTGRLKRFIKVGGEMINLVAIEEEVQKFFVDRGLYESIKVAVVAKELEEQRPRIILCSNYPFLIDEVNQYFKQQGFSSLIRLNEIKTIDPMPLLGSGKIDYQALKVLISS